MPSYLDDLWNDARRRTSVNALKVIAFTAVLFTLTPFGSLYFVVESWGMDNGNPSFTMSTKLMKALENHNNSDLEDIVFKVLNEQKGFVSSHWASVIPWALSMFFCFFVPVLLHIVRLVLDERDSEQKCTVSLSRMCRRRERALRAMKNFSLELDYGETKNECLSFQIPHAGVSRHGKVTHSSNIWFEYQRLKNNNNIDSATSPAASKRLLSGSCCICLNDYKTGDNVAWSSNPQCSHVFHRDCLLEWYSIKRKRKYTCPCCRQNFLTKDEHP